MVLDCGDLSRVLLFADTEDDSLGNGAASDAAALLVVIAVHGQGLERSDRDRECLHCHIRRTTREARSPVQFARRSK